MILFYLQVAEVFTGHAGKLVTLEQTISGFKEILAGKYDHLPEVAFYMVGDISVVSWTIFHNSSFHFIAHLYNYATFLFYKSRYRPRYFKLTRFSYGKKYD